jgi:hypothetical protein
MLVLHSLSCFLLAILVFYKGYQWATCLEYLFLAVLYLFQFNLSFSIFLSTKVLLSFLTFLFELISYSDDFKNLKVLTYLMTTWSNPCHAIIGIGIDVYHYSTGTPTSAAVDRSFHLNPSKHPLTTDHLRSIIFFAPCVGFSISFTDKVVLQERLQTCGKCQDWATVAIYLLSCHKYLSYSCINPFRWLTMIHFGLFIYCKVFVFLLKQSIIGLSKESHTVSIIEFVQQLLHVTLLLFHMGLVALDILNLKEERLEDNDEVVKKCFKLRGFYFESVKLILLIVLAYSWHSHVPSEVLEYDFLVYLLTCLIVGRIVNFIVSRKFQPVHND